VGFALLPREGSGSCYHYEGVCPNTTMREVGYLCVGPELVGPAGDDHRGHHFDLCLGDERGAGLARQAGADHVGMGRGARGTWVRLWRAEAAWMATVNS
jgi:hypothetical protein